MRLDFSGGAMRSRLVEAVEESMRQGRTLFCPRCLTMHHTLLFMPGSEFPCSGCTETLVVPLDLSTIVDEPIEAVGLL